MMIGTGAQLGQFFAARAEFVPEPICRHLSLLHDRVSISDHALHRAHMHAKMPLGACMPFPL